MDDEKKSLRTLVEIRCREDIINLPDIATLRDLKSQWNVESDGPLQSRDDYIRLLLRVYDQRHERTHKVRIVSQSVVNIILNIILGKVCGTFFVMMTTSLTQQSFLQVVMIFPFDVFLIS